MSIVLEDANGVLWTVRANLFGQLSATPGASGTAVGIYLNDTTGASWKLAIGTAGSPIFAESLGTAGVSLVATIVGSNMEYVANSLDVTFPLTASFTIPVHPTPDEEDAGLDFVLFNVSISNFIINGIPAPNDLLVFYTAGGSLDNGGGLIWEVPSLNDGANLNDGAQLFSGSVSSPTMLPGTFLLTWLNPPASSGMTAYPTSIPVDPYWSLTVDPSGNLVTWASPKLRLWQQTVISQYANSPTLLGIIEKFNAAIDPTIDLDNFYSWIWDVDTAQGFGLDIWGRIVGVNRTIQTSPTPTVLNDPDFRSLILLKALSNISIATAPSINKLLQNWIGSEGRAYVNDLGQMAIRYSFEFLLTPVQVVIISESGIFLRPAGVEGWVTATPYPVFGFKEMGTMWAAPLGQAPFLPTGQPFTVA